MAIKHGNVVASRTLGVNLFANLRFDTIQGLHYVTIDKGTRVLLVLPGAAKQSAQAVESFNRLRFNIGFKYKTR